MNGVEVAPRASVLVPVKNGGSLWRRVLDAVLRQKTDWPFEVVVVDSGSRDGSVSVARQRGVRCVEIAPHEFGHGRTRNLLASLARGKFLVYLTQDALPASPSWLARLVAGCDAAPDVACAFGPHLAHPEARPVTRRELAEHFAGFGDGLTVTRLEDRDRFERDPGYRQFLHFFSSNNACIRRSVWERIPFPDVTFAEDQAWALRAIEAGYAKAYVPDAAVYHSHDFGIAETMQRSFDEARSFARYFGYRLQPSWRSTLRSAAALARRDARWLSEAGLRGWRWAGQATWMAACESARVVGQYLGSRHERLPAWLGARLSRDERLQRRPGGRT